MSELASTLTTTFDEALSRAQGAMPNAKFDKKNPHFKNEYASLPAIRDAAQKPLSDNVLAVIQTIEERNGKLWLVTTLRGHGEKVESTYPLPNNAATEPQKFGSALTYARRYSASALLFMASDEDDDANLAQTAGNGKATAEEIISPAQLETLQVELADLVAKDRTFLPRVLEGCKINSLQFMRVADYDYALDRIKAAKKHLAKKEAVS